MDDRQYESIWNRFQSDWGWVNILYNMSTDITSVKYITELQYTEVLSWLSWHKQINQIKNIKN